MNNNQRLTCRTNAQYNGAQIPPTAAVHIAESSVKDASGKLVIIGILAVALAAAGASWWFRYNATRRTADFWGSEDARLIRDAPSVLLYTSEGPDQEISSARGLLHLRAALLEDRSFRWPARAVSDDVDWEHGLIFRDESASRGLPIFFSSDFRWVTELDSDTMLSCEPMANGLREMFTELETASSRLR